MAALVLAILGAAAYGFLRPQGIPVTTAPVLHEDIRSSIVCSGLLQPPAGGEVHVADGGSVAAILVADGARVRKGDLLVRVDNPDLTAQRLDAEQKLLETKTEAAAAAAELRKAEDDESAKSVQVEGDARLLARGALTRSADESDLLNLKAAQASLEAARTRFHSLNDPGERLALAQEKAEDLAARAQALLVRAPLDGVVYGLPRRAGETLTPGQVVANVTDPDRPSVRARMDEPDVPKVTVGEHLLVTFDGLPGESWDGRVTLASAELHDVGNRRVGEALGLLEDRSHRLPLNASVNVEIITGERPKALVVPRTALHHDGDQRYVYLVRRERAEKVVTTIGLVGLTNAEILGGLSDGDSVILSAGASLYPGARVIVAHP